MRVFNQLSAVVYFIWVLVAFEADCLAATSKQIAAARVSVALAQLEVAELKPKLPDQPPRPRTVRIEYPRAARIDEPLPAQIVIGVWENGCSPCKKCEKDIYEVLTPRGWSVGNGPENQIQFIHIPQTEVVPQITLYQNGHELKKWTGYKDPGFLSKELREAWDHAPPMTSAYEAGVGGSVHARDEISKAIGVFRQYIGEGRQAKFSWDRTGAGNFPLLAKGDWSVKALFGEAGRMDLSAPGATRFPIDAIGFAYRIVGPDIVIDPDPITVPGLASRLGPSQHGASASESATPVQFIDPLTAWSIFSMLREFWELLHPTCDLILGGNISGNILLNGDTLEIAFKEPPSIKLVALFTFNLRVKRVEISERRVHVDFGGSRLIKSRTFDVK